VSAVTDLVRWVVLGRNDGLRAALRARLGVFTWVDRPHPEVRPPTSARPAAQEPLRAGWTRLLGSDELLEGQLTEAVAGDQRLALSRVQGQIYAVDGVCRHAAGPLGEGQLDGFTLTCPIHGWSYDVRTGRTDMDAEAGLRTFKIAEEAGSIWLVP
jgi:nitrite reductase (NADH) small subunit